MQPDPIERIGRWPARVGVVVVVGHGSYCTERVGGSGFARRMPIPHKAGGMSRRKPAFTSMTTVPAVLRPPESNVAATGCDWVGITTSALPVDEANAWAATPQCGAIVCFSGIVRDHSEGRAGVTGLTYEAYESEATTRLAAVATEARRRWPMVGRLALLHRIGDLALSDTSVVVVASAPHRAEAFEAARFCIDTLKETVPIWKQEHWDGGSDWATCAHSVRSVSAPVSRPAPASRSV
jgi:molybdopterin synthase catalytic subunit